MQRLGTNLTGILFSFSTSIVSSIEDLNILANLSGFAGVALTGTLIYKNIQDAKYRKAETELLKLKADSIRENRISDGKENKEHPP